MNIVAIIAVFSALFVVIEVIKRRWSVSPEISRKSAHILSAMGAAALPLAATYTEVAIASGFFIPVMAVSKSKGLFSAVHEVQRTTLGEVYFPVAVCLMAILFPHTLPYVFGLLVMGISDAVASIAGQRFGKRQYRIFSVSKSYVGSMTFAAVTFLIASLLLFAFTGLPLVEVFGISIICTLLLTVIEAVSGYGTDNIVVPLAGGAVMTWFV